MKTFKLSALELSDSRRNLVLQPLDRRCVLLANSRESSLQTIVLLFSITSSRLELLFRPR
jgi:hypothetical protein